jgi:hypothetical protein
MSFREWLPITTRNRVALLLTFAALVMFVAWNFLPVYHDHNGPSMGIAATIAWPQVFSPDSYLPTLRSPDIEGFVEITANLALIVSGIVTLAAVPFWKLLHASPYIRLPLAGLNVLGGAVVLSFLYKNGLDDPPRHFVALMLLISMSMFALSAALFTFRNELGLRSEKEVREVSGKGGAA